MRKILAIFMIFTAIFAFAKPQVSVSILPTKYFLEQIAGDTLNINVMVTKGADAHTYEPKPKQMKELENSALYFAVGIEFEDVWLKKFEQNYPNLKVVYTQKGIEKLKMLEHDEHEHEHTPHCDHEHAEFDPHIWLDPLLVKAQAKNIAIALSQEFPQNSEFYTKNLVKFNAKLDELDAKIKDMLKDLKNRRFMVYHPSWGYFANRYNLEQIAIEAQGKDPKPAQLAQLIDEAKEHGIKVIFVAPNFSKKAANLIATQTGAFVSEVDQLPIEWESELMRMAQILAKAKE